MKKIVIAEPEAKQMEINGHVFDVLRGDAEILERALAISQSGEKYKEMETRELVVAITGIVNYVDEILGPGAMKKIAGGKPVGLMYAIGVLQQVCTAIQEDYAEDLARKYE